jgi:hypothetical protein
MLPGLSRRRCSCCSAPLRTGDARRVRERRRLLLARGRSARELRCAALGASRARLMRQLSRGAHSRRGSAALALVIARLATRLVLPLMTAFAPGDAGRVTDWRVVLFAPQRRRRSGRVRSRSGRRHQKQLPRRSRKTSQAALAGASADWPQRPGRAVQFRVARRQRRRDAARPDAAQPGTRFRLARRC